MTATRLRYVFIALLMVVLQACVSNVRREAFVGDQSGVTRQFAGDGAQYAALNTMDHYWVCSAFQLQRNYKQFFDCIARLEDRLKKGNGKLDSEQTFGSDVNSPAWSQVKVLALKAKTYLDLGAFTDAIRTAESAMQVIERKALWSGRDRADNGGYTTLERLTTPGLMDMEAGVRTGEEMPLLGVIGMAKFGLGDLDGARASAKAIAAHDTTGFYSNGYDGQRRLWLARIHSALGDYPAAYAALTDATQLSSGGQVLKALLAVNTINPARFVALPYYTGTASFDDLAYAYELEPRFLLHYAELETGRLADARKGFDAILAEPRAQGYGGIYYGALQGRGRVSAKEGKWDAAITDYAKAIDTIEQQRRSIDTDAYKVGFVGDKQSTYADMVQALVHQGQHAKAFEYAERGKARALVDMLAAKKSFAGSAADAGRVAPLLASLDDADDKLTRDRGTDRAGGLRNLKVQVTQQISDAAPEVASLVSVRPESAGGLMAKLADGELLIEYFGFKDELYAFAVQRQGVTTRKVDTAGLIQQVNDLRTSLLNPKDESYRQTGAQLYQRLLGGFPDLLRNPRSITIVPHGVLHYVPFAALIDGQGAYLLDRARIRVLPSASALLYLKDRKQGHSGDLLVLGNPDLKNPALDLPGAEAEARAIMKGRQRSTLMTRLQATETLVKQAGNRYRVLHFASHGKFDAAKPLDSAIYLAADAQNDGRLTVSELYDLTLNADLVTLSACETALGKIANGDDVIGLNRGFLFAGASSIVSSLWEVDDQATRVLMESFYQNLGRQNKQEALRTAQLHVRNTFRAHPNYWSAFQLTGATD